MRQWALTYPARPVSLNASYGHSRYDRTAHVIEWRQAFWLLAKEAKIPPLTAIEVLVHCGMSGKLQDIGNCYTSAKAAIDGLVLARVIPDDTGDHVHLLSFTPPKRIAPKEHDYMTLVVTEVEHDAAENMRGDR